MNHKFTALLLVLALSSSVQTSHAFRQQSLRARSPRVGSAAGRKYLQPLEPWKSPTSLEMVAKPEAGKASLSLLGALRGGAVLAGTTAAVTGALQSGPFGTLGLAAVTSAVVTPLTIYRQIYSFTVAYAFTWPVVALVFSNSFPAGGALAQSLLGAMTFYGLRLGIHLLVREATVASKRKVIVNFDKTPRLSRIPFSLGVGLFFAFMGTPALYLCRAGSGLTGTAAQISTIGVNMAWFAAIVEAWTDLQKLWAKRGKDEAMDFTGPKTWWWGVSRHPNYAAEITFWLSILLSGLPAMLAPSVLTVGSGVAAVLSLMGIFGILQTMFGATKRLEEKQDDKYGGQIPFEEWKANTSKLFPTKVSLGMILPVAISVGLTMVLKKAVVSCLCLA